MPKPQTFAFRLPSVAQNFYYPIKNEVKLFIYPQTGTHAGSMVKEAIDIRHKCDNIKEDCRSMDAYGQETKQQLVTSQETSIVTDARGNN